MRVGPQTDSNLFINITAGTASVRLAIHTYIYSYSFTCQLFA